GMIIGILHSLGHRDLSLTDEQLRVLYLGNEIAGWWNENPQIRQDYPWYTAQLFMSHVAMHGQLIADMEAAAVAEDSGDPDSVGAFGAAQLAFIERIMAPIGLMEEIRIDTALAEDAEAGGTWI